jgi:hypothetical protein
MIGALLVAGATACGGGGSKACTPDAAVTCACSGRKSGCTGAVAGNTGEAGADASGTGGTNGGGGTMGGGAAGAGDAGGSGGAGRDSDAGDAAAPDADAGGGDADSGDPFALDRDQCARNWQVAFTGQAGDTALPSRDLMRVGGDRIFLGRPESGGTWAITSLASGGAPKVLHEGPLSGFWLDGDSIVYSENNALFTIPQGGGPPDPGVQYGTNIAEPNIFDRALDAHFVYWFQDQPVAINAPIELWRLARNGGVEEMLFSFTDDETRGRPLNWIQVVGDRVLVYSQGDLNNAFAWSVSTTMKQRTPLPVPLAGPSDPLTYSAYSTLLGVSEDGALLWTRPYQTLRDMGDEPYRSFVYALGSVSGGALVPFDVRLPPRTIPLAAWPAGAGAWYLAATEEPQEDHVLASVWLIDAGGRASRIACDPLDWSDATLSGSQDHRRDALIPAAAVTPGGLTFAIRYYARAWTIVNVANPRPPAADGGPPAP